jgi:hypothetical protein
MTVCLMTTCNEYIYINLLYITKYIICNNITYRTLGVAPVTLYGLGMDHTENTASHVTIVLGVFVAAEM